MTKQIIHLIVLTLFISSPIFAEVELPAPKIEISLNSISIPQNVNIIVNGNINADLSLAIDRVKQAFNLSSQPNAIFSITFCRLEQLESCTDQNSLIWNANKIVKQGIEDEYALLPRLNRQTNKVSGIALAARSIQGWQYAIDHLLERYDVNSSQYKLSLIHDYPSFEDRAIFSTENNPSIDYWKNRIDIAAKLRIKELSLSLVFNNKLAVNSSSLQKYPKKLFDTNSAFYKNPKLVNEIIYYGRLRGVNIIPTIPHPSSFKLFQYFPDWTMPNGRAINWRAKGPNQFINDLILAAVTFEGVNKISFWADEGGVIDRQKDFIKAITTTINHYKISTGNKLALRFMIAPVVSVAIRKNRIGNFAKLLPTDTSIDFYSGIGYPAEPGTYHIETPKIWNDVLLQVNRGSKKINFSGVGFAKRSQFNKVVFPYTHYIDSFLDEIKKYSGKGEYIYLGANYKTLESTEVQYLSHRLWSGTSNSLIFKNEAINAKWLLNYPQISELWEKMMRDTFLSQFQRFRLRKNPKKPETVRNLKTFITEAKTGQNTKWITTLETNITALEQALKKYPLPIKEVAGIENIKISLLISKTLLEVRKLAETIYLMRQTKNGSITLTNQLKQSVQTITTFCNNSQIKNRWKSVEKSPHCAYLPIIKKPSFFNTL